MDLAPFLVAPKSTLREVISINDKGSLQIAIVVDENLK